MHFERDETNEQILHTKFAVKWSLRGNIPRNTFARPNQAQIKHNFMKPTKLPCERFLKDIRLALMYEHSSPSVSKQDNLLLVCAQILKLLVCETECGSEAQEKVGHTEFCRHCWTLFTRSCTEVHKSKMNVVGGTQNLLLLLPRYLGDVCVCIAAVQVRECMCK